MICEKTFLFYEKQVQLSEEDIENNVSTEQKLCQLKDNIINAFRREHGAIQSHSQVFVVNNTIFILVTLQYEV